MSERLKEVKINFLPSEVEALTLEANANGISRSALIRQRATSPAQTIPALRQGPKVYAECVEAAAQAIPGIPRTQLESLVSKVINTLASTPNS